MTNAYTPSVWDALAAPAESSRMRLRSELTRHIQAQVRAMGLTQVEAATICKISQPRLNMLLNGKLLTFSTDALINIALAAGLQIELVIKEAK